MTKFAAIAKEMASRTAACNFVFRRVAAAEDLVAGHGETLTTLGNQVAGQGETLTTLRNQVAGHGETLTTLGNDVTAIGNQAANLSVGVAELAAAK